MSGCFSIDVDPSRDLLRIVLAGFFDADAVTRFDAARRAAHLRLGCGPNQHVTLCDVSECKLQSQDMVGAFREVMLNPQLASRRFAFVIGTSVAKMQVRRLLERDDVACFEDRASAEAWLLGPPPAVRAA